MRHMRHMRQSDVVLVAMKQVDDITSIAGSPSNRGIASVYGSTLQQYNLSQHLIHGVTSSVFMTPANRTTTTRTRNVMSIEICFSINLSNFMPTICSYTTCCVLCGAVCSAPRSRTPMPSTSRLLRTRRGRCTACAVTRQPPRRSQRARLEILPTRYSRQSGTCSERMWACLERPRQTLRGGRRRL